MRILLDTNIWISYLLARHEHNIMRRLVRACIGTGRELLVPPELIEELQRSLVKHPYLAARIFPAEVDALLQEFTEIALIPNSLNADFPRYSRDRQDDYLLAHALVNQADFLVSGDKDLLVLEVIEEVQIVSPVQMKNILMQLGFWI